MSKAQAALLSAIKARAARVGVVGLGYVGLPLAITAAQRGFSVTGFDIDPDKMTLLDAAESYISAVTSDDIAALNASGHFDWTTDFRRLSDCQVIVICVPTPLTQHREPDLRFVKETATVIARHMTPGALVILESTTFPGTTAEVLTPILQSHGARSEDDLFVAFSPEREDPGNEKYRTSSIPKIVGADGAKARALAKAFYADVVDDVVGVSNAATAEAVKLTENIFRAVNIALVNELKVIYDAMGIDVWDVIDGASTKPFGYMPFYPGPGLGGHCIPIDPFYLTWKARQYALSTRFIELAGEINVGMPTYVIGRLREVLDRHCGKGLSKSRVLIIGISYKKNVPDMRESPSVKLLSLLLDAGAEVDFHDPHIDAIPKMRDYPDFEGRRSVSLKTLGSAEYDAILISTDHDAVDYTALSETGLPIIDTRNAFARRGLPMHNVTKA
ncbi:MAG: nucleotide sugar dehydrogenase [Pseudomonadota bacterium]